MYFEQLLPSLILLPVLLAGISLLARTQNGALKICARGSLLVSALTLLAASLSFRGIALDTPGRWLRLDALSAWHFLVMALVFALVSAFATRYYRQETLAGRLTLKQARRYASLWFGTQSALLLVLSANNLGLLWAGIEASTLLTAFLITIHITPASLEAMWKYLLMCSVGVALAFVGILLLAAAASSTSLSGSEVMLWTNLREAASQLNPMMVKVGFIFLLVGFGVKAGLAPMHNWLPDAHSQAPGPVSAIFSGFMLNAALYGALRCLPIVETATGNINWAGDILIVLGLLSVVMAAALIVAQQDLKRLLAYSSIEHIGVMALGFGIGGLAAVAALFHLLCHALAKSLAFCCAGRLGQIYNTHDMRYMTKITSASPWAGTGLLVSMLVLIGAAPLAMFLSEFLIVKTAVEQGRLLTTVLLLFGLGVAFIVMARRAITMAWQPAEQTLSADRASFSEITLIPAALVVLLVLGIFWPTSLTNILSEAAEILQGAL